MEERKTRNRKRVPGSRRDIQEKLKRPEGRPKKEYTECLRGDNPLAEDRTTDRKRNHIRSKSNYIAAQFNKYLEDSLQSIIGDMMKYNKNSETFDIDLLNWYKCSHSTIGEIRTIKWSKFMHLNSIPMNTVTMEQYTELLEEIKDYKLLDKNALRANWDKRQIDMYAMIVRHGAPPWKIVDVYKSRCRVILINKDLTAYGVCVIGGKEDADYGSLVGKEAFDILDAICIKTTKYKLETQVNYYLSKHPEIDVTKLTAPKQRIESVDMFRDKEIKDVYSFDRNRAFGYGIASQIESLKPAIEYIEERLKKLTDDSVERNFWKSIINMAVGYCGIKDINGNYKSNLGILDYIARTENIKFTDNLEKMAKDSQIIAINYATDCVRVIGPEDRINLFKSKISDAYGIGNNLGGVKVEKYQKFRAKLDGAYEYIREDGTYKCAYRGKKKEEGMSWGWLYKEGIARYRYKFNDDGTIVRVEDKEDEFYD